MRTTGSTGYTPPSAGSAPPAAHAASHADGGSDPVTAEAIGAVTDLSGVTGLTGGGVTKLDGVATAGGARATNTLVSLFIGTELQFWRLEAGTDVEDADAGVVRPDDYHADTNARVWKRRL